MSTQEEEEALEAHIPIHEAVLQELFTVQQPVHLLDSPYIADCDAQAWVEAIREGWECRGHYDPIAAQERALMICHH